MKRVDLVQNLNIISLNVSCSPHDITDKWPSGVEEKYFTYSFLG